MKRPLAVLLTRCEHRSEPALPSVPVGEDEGVQGAPPVKPFLCLCKSNWQAKRVDSAAGCCFRVVYIAVLHTGVSGKSQTQTPTIQKPDRVPRGLRGHMKPSCEVTGVVLE